MKLYFIILLMIFSINIFYAENLKILWWNVENFFDTTDDPETDDTILTKEQYDKKLNLISEKLKKINADIIGLTEIENIGILKDLAKKSNYVNYYLEKGNDPRGINIALLSKYLVTYISHKNQKTPYKGNINYKFSRDCPEVLLNINNKKLCILLNHLKSRVADKNENTDIKRIAQINGIMDIIASIYEKNTIEPDLLILGDLNTERHSLALNNLEKSGLIIINYFYDEKKYFSTLYKNKKADSDYILMNKSLYKKTKIKKYISYNSSDYKQISDHFPLYLEINF